MGHMVDNYIEDKQNKELLDAGIFDTADKKLSSKAETNINERVEKSFQGFLKKYEKNKVIENEEAYEALFNERLDKEVGAILSDEELKEVGDEIIAVKKNLIDLEFEIDLTKLQSEIQEDRDEKETKIEIQWVDISMDIYDNIEPEEIEEFIKQNNFKSRKEIIDLMESWTKEDVRRIQYILIWKDYEQRKIIEWDFNEFWTDWYFGDETFTALKNYANADDTKLDNSLLGSFENGTRTENTETTSNGTQSGTESTETTVSETVVDSWSETTSTYPSSLEKWPEYGWKSFYEGEVGDTVELAGDWKKFPIGTTFETLPFGKNIELKDGKLEYKISTKEEVFRVRAFDVDGEEIYNKVMTVKAKWVEWEGEDILDENWKIDEFKSFMKELSGTFRNKSNLIWAEISKYKTEYQEYVLGPEPKKSLLSSDDSEFERKMKEYENKKFKIEKNKEEYEKRRAEIVKIVDKLLIEEEKYNLFDWFDDFSDSNRENIKTKFSDTSCRFYFGWKDFDDTDKFLDMFEKGQITANNFNIIDLDVDWEVGSEDYLENVDVPKHSIITSIMLSDDSFSAKDMLTKDEQIQYKGEKYVKTTIEKQKMRNDKQAIKNILWIKWLFGRGWVNEDMSIATEDYNSKNPVFKEKQNLRKLKRILMSFYTLIYVFNFLSHSCSSVTKIHSTIKI